MIKVLFLIPALIPGGAERQLIELVKGLDKTHFAPVVVSFYAGGALQSELDSAANVRVVSVDKEGPRDVVGFCWRLWRLVCEVRPHILVGYMSFASDIGLLLGRLAGAKVVWSLRASNVDYSRFGWAMLWTFRVGAWLSRWADLIIVNSQAGQRHHVAQGYCPNRLMVIPNGIDTNHFRPDEAARRRRRAAWQMTEADVVIGLVGRIDVMKDHPTFLRAAAILARDFPEVRFVCVGTGAADYLAELNTLAEHLDLTTRLTWAGIAHDMPAVYNALDLHTSASIGEGFSNALGEAMACGVPCVATDVGDSAVVIGATGWIVAPRDPEALANAWRIWLRLDTSGRVQLAHQARARIETEFNLERMVAITEAVLEKLVAADAG